MRSVEKAKKSTGRRNKSTSTPKSDPSNNAQSKKKSRVRGRGEQQSRNSPKKTNPRKNNRNASSGGGRQQQQQHSKSGGGPTSKVPHDLPMGKKDLYFALDCEMVGVGPHGVDSALARVSIVNYDCEIVLDTFVKVPVPVTDYRTYVSGVRSEDIESSRAVTLEEAREAVQNILRGKILIGHGLENDLKALMMTHPWCDTRDTATYEPYMKRVEDIKGVSEKSGSKNLMLPRRLKDLSVEVLGKEIQVLGRPHSPIEDGLAALELYKAVRPEWEERMCAQVKKANDMENSSMFKSFRLPALGRRVQVQPSPMYTSPPPSPPNTSSRLHQKQQLQQHYMNLTHSGHVAMPGVNPNNVVYMADGRPMYFVPQNVYKQASPYQ